MGTIVAEVSARSASRTAGTRSAGGDRRPCRPTLAIIDCTDHSSSSTWPSSRSGRRLRRPGTRLWFQARILARNPRRISSGR
ncbi:hypothetical protein [Actinomadura madurae]|uniref:hypothetical protein n=1 Tax=Actinomadura madurae TaxID=1993 RepID=UPI0020D23047|nr:hypothetical protein [Actinomadura madurae]MCQ0015374.1 hypothetical protein [Actinomadura madurae]